MPKTFDELDTERIEFIFEMKDNLLEKNYNKVKEFRKKLWYSEEEVEKLKEEKYHEGMCDGLDK